MKQQEPLVGIRVLEIGSMAAGPFCGRLLGDFGAEVIKIEQPDGDPGRFLGEHYKGVSLQAKSIMRNKKNVCIDLHSPKGQNLVRQLVAASDVVVENFRPKTLERWNVGYNDLRKVNPKLIMARISGYGQYGPYSELPGYGGICEALSGLRNMTGDPDRPPSRAALPLTDFLSGLYAAFAILMALRYREMTGKGQEIDLALYEAAFSFMHAFVPTYEKTGKAGSRAGNRLPNMAPNNLYNTKDQKYFSIAVGSQSMFHRLLNVMGREDLVANAKFADHASRAQHEDELDAIIATWAASHTAAELQQVLGEAGVASGPVYTMADIFKDKHFRVRHMLETVPDPDFGSITLSGIIPKMSESPGSIKWSGAGQGRHTEEVLKDLLKMTEVEIKALEHEHVVKCGMVGAFTEDAAF